MLAGSEFARLKYMRDEQKFHLRICNENGCKSPAHPKEPEGWVRAFEFGKPMRRREGGDKTKETVDVK